MTNRIVRCIAYFLSALAVLAALIGVVVTVIFGLSMTGVIPKIAVILGGFILTAISATILMAISQLALLFLRIEENLAGLVAVLKSKTGD